MIKTVKYGDVTTSPSDYECPDGDLDVCIGGTINEQSIEPILPGKTIASLDQGMKPLYVHKCENYEHVICYNNEGLYYYSNGTKVIIADVEGYFSDSPDNCSSIGNIIVLCSTTDEKILYLIWNGEQYIKLGDHLPEIKIRFTNSGYFDGTGTVVSRVNIDGTDRWDELVMNSPIGTMELDISSGSETGGDIVPIPEDKQKDVTERYLASYNTLNAKRKKLGLFLYPHLIRYALILHTGEYAIYSQPVLIWGRGTANCLQHFANSHFKTVIHPYTIDYYIENKEELVKWKDIVKGVAFFVSNEIPDFDQNGTATEVLFGTGTKKDFFSIDMSLPDSTIRDKVKGAFTFYKICEVLTDDYSGHYSYLTFNSPLYSGSDDTHRPIQQGTLTLSIKITRYDPLVPVYEVITENIDISAGEDVKSIANKIIDRFKSTDIGASLQYVSNSTWHIVDGAWHDQRYLFKIVFTSIHKLEITACSFTPSSGTSEMQVNYGNVSGQALLTKDTPLSTLEQQTSITDDFWSHCKLYPADMHNFNGRIIYTGIKRDFYQPSKSLLTTSRYLPSYVVLSIWYQLKINGKQIYVKDDNTTILNRVFLNYLYYPDTRCDAAIVKVNIHKVGSVATQAYLKLPMESSDFLNGSVFFSAIPREDGNPWGDWGPVNTSLSKYVDSNITTDPVVTEDTEVLDNSLCASNLNDPFSWGADGWHTAGNGKIIAISSITTAISQGQFGQYGLYAFCSDGTYAIPVDTNTGKFDTPSIATRDVVINRQSLCQIDNAVLFVSARGLMLLNAQTSVCLTDSLTNRHFDITKLPKWNNLKDLTGIDPDALDFIPMREFLDNCRTVYDYVNQRIIIFNTNQEYAYVFNQRSKTFGMIQCNYMGSLNSYPDAYVFTSDAKVLNISQISDSFSESSDSVPVFIVTRPFKLDDPDGMKTIRRIYQRGTFRTGHVKQLLYASRDLFNWIVVGTSSNEYMFGISGTAFKYFRVAAICYLRSDESAFGFTADYDYKYTNKLR